MNEINLNLTVEETQVVINVLGDLPSKSNVYPLIQKILRQAQDQAKTQVE